MTLTAWRNFVSFLLLMLDVRARESVSGARPLFAVVLPKTSLSVLLFPPPPLLSLSLRRGLM
jgi:hypothetical protein